MTFGLNTLDSFWGFAVGKLKDFFLHVHDHIVPNERNLYRPHALSNRALSLYALLLVSVKISSIALIFTGQVNLADALEISNENIFNLTNISRTENNLRELKWSDSLAKAAQAKAEDMLKKGYFSHTSPDGRLPWDFINSTGYNYLTAGENLAEGFMDAESTESAWMNSPGHRANILNKNYEEIGVGISTGMYLNKRTIFVVQMFGTELEQPIRVLDTPTPVAQLADSSSGSNRDLGENASKDTSENVEELKIKNIRPVVQNDQVLLTVVTSMSTTRVLGVYGENAFPLEPMGGGVWEGRIELSKLNGNRVIIEAWGAEKKVVQEAATFKPSVHAAFSENAELTQPVTVKVFGKSINVPLVEDKFYLLFIAVILTILVIGIAVKKHIQHVDLVANTAFVVIMATLFWL